MQRFTALKRWLTNPAHRRLLFIVGGVLVAVFALNTVLAKGGEIALKPTPKPTPDPRWHQFHGDCTTYGVAYRDPHDEPEDREKVFGPPDTLENLTVVPFFDYAAHVHVKVAPCLEAVERDLRDQGTTYQPTVIGSYREERADRAYWFHQYGGAIDIDPARNPQCLKSREGVDPAGRCKEDKPYDLPQEWIDTFERYGFYWGGNFTIGKDYMHFEWHGEGP